MRGNVLASAQIWHLDSVYGSFPALGHLRGWFILHFPGFIKVIYAERLSREPVIDDSVWKIAIFQPHQNQFPTNVAALDIGYEISKYHAEVAATGFSVASVLCWLYSTEEEPLAPAVPVLSSKTSILSCVIQPSAWFIPTAHPLFTTYNIH